MDVPEEWRLYACDEYFRDGWAQRGHFDDESQTLVIAPLIEAYENVEFEFFAIGSSGWDGIDFGYRKDHPGLWAFYPISCEFRLMATSVVELVDGWCSGRLKV